MKVIRQNVINSIRVLSASIPFFLFIVIGTVVEAEPYVLLIGGLVTWFVFYLLGQVVADILTQLDKETDVRPIEKKESLSKKLGLNIDLTQEAELPE